MRYFWLNILLYLSLSWGGSFLFHNFAGQGANSEADSLFLFAEQKGEQGTGDEIIAPVKWDAVLALQQQKRTNPNTFSVRAFSYQSVVGKTLSETLKRKGEREAATALNYLQELFKKQKAFEQSGGYYIYALRKIVI